MTDIVRLDKTSSAAGAATEQPPRTLMPISVNLLPDEVIRARAGASARRVTVIALLVVAALMGAWYFQAHQAASSAQDTLDQANAQTAIAKRAQLKYAGLTQTKADIQTIGSKLKQATKGDVAWATLITRIRAQAPAGVGLTGITGSSASEQQTPDPSGAPGALVLNGIALSEAGVHQFADRLGTVPGLSSAFVTSVAADDKNSRGLTFSISLVVTKKALNARYAKAGTR